MAQVKGKALAAVEGYVLLTLAFTQEDDRWVGVCAELSTSTFAHTLEECQQELKALVTEHLNLLEEVGAREAFFEKWDIEFVRKLPQKMPDSFSAWILKTMKNQAPVTVDEEGPSRSGPLFEPWLTKMPLARKTPVSVGR